MKTKTKKQFIHIDNVKVFCEICHSLVEPKHIYPNGNKYICDRCDNIEIEFQENKQHINRAFNNEK